MDVSKYRVTADSEISDIDLDQEEFILGDGSRLTEARAEQLGEEVAARRASNLIPGRKSLSGGATHSPVLQVRLPADLHARVRQAAADQQTSPSRLARAALEQYLERGT